MLLTAAAERLGTVAGSAARLEAELLAAQAAGVSRAGLLAQVRAPMAPQARAAFKAAVGRREAGEPLAYVLGRAPFLDFEVRVTPAVLVPRPETELLAEWAIGQVRRNASGGSPLTVLDVGTGSGVLAIAIARACPAALVVGTDTSGAALAIATDNARAHGLAARVALLQADLWPPGPTAFDIVVANLPYVATDELADVAPDVLAWEPHAALFAGRDGLALLARFAAGITARLGAGGAVGLEVGWRQAAAVERMLIAALPDHAVTSLPDDAGIQRLVVATPSGSP